MKALDLSIKVLEKSDSVWKSIMTPHIASKGSSSRIGLLNECKIFLTNVIVDD